jgi:hypothetical protein
MFEFIELQEIPTDETFDERAGPASNPDAAAAIASGALRSGSARFAKFGRAEGWRRLSPAALVAHLSHEADFIDDGLIFARRPRR